MTIHVAYIARYISAADICTFIILVYFIFYKLRDIRPAAFGDSGIGVTLAR